MMETVEVAILCCSVDAEVLRRELNSVARHNFVLVERQADIPLESERVAVVVALTITSYGSSSFQEQVLGLFERIRTVTHQPLVRKWLLDEIRVPIGFAPLDKCPDWSPIVDASE